MPAANTNRTASVQHHRTCILHVPDLLPLARLVAAGCDRHTTTSVCVSATEPLPLHALANVDACVVLLSSCHSDQDAAELNVQLEQLKIPTLFVSCGSERVRVGPWCHYGHTACLACVDSISRCFADADTTRGRAGQGLDDADLAGLIENTFTAILARCSPLLDGAVLHHDGADRVEYVLKDPLCPVCSSWSRQPMETLYAQHG